LTEFAIIQYGPKFLAGEPSMRRTLTLLTLAALLASCGPSGGGAGGGAADNQTCALISDAATIFGEGVDIVGHANDGAIAADCQFTSANGARTGAVMLFTQQSLGATAADAQFTELVQTWDAQTDTPLEPVEGLGDQAQLARDLPGYQTQIVIRSGGSIIAVLGNSGEGAMSGEQIARTLAAQALASASSSP
jgi:hypothetical protein